MQNQIEVETIRAERGCIASMMLHLNYHLVKEYVDTVDFCDPMMAKAFTLLGACQSQEINTFDSVVMEPLLKNFGLPSDLKQMLMGYASQQPDISYARKVRKLAQMRKLYGMGVQLMHLLDDPDCDMTEAYSLWDQGAALASKEKSLSQIDKLNDTFADFLRRLNEAAKPAVTIETGLTQLDYIGGGIAMGEMVCLGAYTGHGKSAFALQLAWNVAASGLKVLVCSLEMTTAQYMNRMAIAYGGVSPQSMRAGQLTEEEQQKINDMMKLRAGENIYIRNPQGGLSISEIERDVHCSVAEDKCDLLIVDHMGLVKSPGRTTYEKVTETSNRLKQLAITHDIPVLSLSQLNGRDDKVVPTLGSLRDSGAIEQDSDMVWLLHRPGKGTDATLYIAKNRQGTAGKFSLRYNGARYAFDDIPIEEYDDFGPTT